MTGKADNLLPKYFNPRPPRGGRPPVTLVTSFGLLISIHAPREGGDCIPCAACWRTRYFNPRPPRGGRLSYAGGAAIR